jgi:hypothetical protein
MPQENVITVVDKSGTVYVICESDFPEYEAKGFSIVTEGEKPKAAKKKAKKKAAKKTPTAPKSDRLETRSLAELNVIADDEDLDLPAKAKRAAIIKAIRKARGAQ